MPRAADGSSSLPFTEYELTRALRLTEPQGVARREARRLTRLFPKLIGVFGPRSLDVPFAGLLALLAVRTPELEARADAHVRKVIEKDYPFDLLFEESHGLQPRAQEDRWQTWQTRKQEALQLAQRRYPALRQDKRP